MEKEKVGRSITLTTATFGRRYPNFQQIVGYSALIRGILNANCRSILTPAILTRSANERNHRTTRDAHLCRVSAIESILLDLQIGSAISTSKQTARRGRSDQPLPVASLIKFARRPVDGASYVIAGFPENFHL